MAIKLIALDLDGTLLTNDKTVSKANREAIRWATEQNIEVAFATGRSMGIIPPDAFNLKDIRYIITSNGAVISDRRKGVIGSEYIPAESVDMIVSALRGSDNMIEVFMNGVPHVQTHYNEQIMNAVKAGEDPYFYVYHRESEDDIFEYIQKFREYIELIIVSFPRGEDPRNKMLMEDRIRQIPGLSITTSLPYNIEIGSEKAGKGNALVKLGEILGLERNEIMSMGDSLNDMTMPGVSGICVAMGNAHEDVKGQAQFITKTNMEDGVAHAIYEMVEQSKEES